MIDNCVPGIAGAAAGALLALWLVHAMLGLLPPDLPRLDEITVDLRVLAF